MDILKYEKMICAAELRTDKDRYFMVANTGTPMRLTFSELPVVIDMTGAEFAGEKLPVLYGHDVSQPIGTSVSRTILGVGERKAVKDTVIVGPAIVAEWQFTNTQESTRSIKENIDNGFPFQVSIGAQPIEIERVAPGETVHVNGQDYPGPLLVTRKSLVKELSVVVFGADRFTQTIKAQEKGVLNMSNIENPVPEIPKIESAEPTQTVEKQGVPDMNAMQEQMRILSIETIANTIAATGTVGEIELEGGVIFRSAEAAESYAKKNASVSADAFKKAMLDASRKRPVGPVAPGIHAKNHDVTNEVMECAILKSVAREANIPLLATTTKDGVEKYGLEAWFDEKTLEAADAPELRNPSLGTVYATQIRQVFGFNEFVNPKSDTFWQRAGEAYSQARFAGYGIQAAAGSPISLDVVWLNVARKILLATSQGIPTTYQQWCKIINVQDFKPTTLYSVDLDGTLSPVGNNGVLEHGRMDDQSFTVQTRTFGKIYGITRVERINDDINAYLSKFVTIGKTVPKTVEQLAYYVLQKGANTYFTAKRGNLMSGTDTVYSQEAVKAVRKTYRNRVGFDKQPIVADPDRVIVGVSLEDIAQTLYTKEHPVFAYKTGKENEIRYQTMENDVRGRLRPIVTPYLDNTAINQTIFKDDDRVFPNQSSTQYFVTCDPNSPEGAAFYIPCLHGNINPHVEAYDFGAGMLGTGVQVYADFNVVPGKVEMMTKVTGQ
ncbi:MAG: hypothetical protein Q4D62_12420 [Planctomycetia bacterium]|nr:hypothetical protein [Planctomycetia bacterium]